MLFIFEKNSPFPDPFPKGAVMLIDKPLGWTSFDVVNKIRFHLRKRLGVKKLKIGHAGTLDPLATGLLILCVGEYTRKIDLFQQEEKEYEGVITFGGVTASYDLEKTVENPQSVADLDNAAVQAAAGRFIGQIQQYPPVFSAVKVEGKRLYKNARSGEEVEIAARTVQIDAFEVSELRPTPSADTQRSLENVVGRGNPIWRHPDLVDSLQVDFRVVCGKGTYIRSLADDMGTAVGTGAYLSALRRTRSGGFEVKNAWTLEEFFLMLDA